MKEEFAVQDGYVLKEETHLTVLKTSLFFAGDGFKAYNSNGQLVFRVDSYTREQDEVVLMDPKGRCLLTLRRKPVKLVRDMGDEWVWGEGSSDSFSTKSAYELLAKKFAVEQLQGGADSLLYKRPSLHQRWEGFKGERTEGDKAMFSVKRSSIIGRSQMSVTVEVYDNSGVEYHIEGCFSQRCCKIFNAVKKELVSEIRRKVDPTTSVMLGKEVFSLYIKRGFDLSFVVGLILVLDQINN